MGFLSSIPFLSIAGGVVGVSSSLLLMTAAVAMWTLVTMIMHPLHALIALISAACEYGLICLFGVKIWLNLVCFLLIYLLLYAIYYFWLRFHLPLPKSQMELLVKLADMKQKDMLSDDEFKAAKKRLLKI